MYKVKIYCGQATQKIWSDYKLVIVLQLASKENLTKIHTRKNNVREKQRFSPLFLKLVHKYVTHSLNGEKGKRKLVLWRAHISLEKQPPTPLYRSCT